MTRVGIVLGGGGPTGQAFHAGVLDELRIRTGLDAARVEVLLGTSVGSVVASGLAAGLPVADLPGWSTGAPLSATAQALHDRIASRRAEPGTQRVGSATATDRRRSGGLGRLGRPGPPADPLLVLRAALPPWDVAPGALVSAALPAGSASTERIRDAIDGLLDAWPRGLEVTAVALGSGRHVVFGTPDAPHASPGSAVAASCAVPAFFQPVEIDGTRYVDGGARSPTNADLLAGRGLDLVLVSAPMSAAPGAARRAWPILSRGWSRRALTREKRRLRDHGTAVVGVVPQAQGLQSMALDLTAKIDVAAVVEAGRDALRVALDNADDGVCRALV